MPPTNLFARRVYLLHKASDIFHLDIPFACRTQCFETQPRASCRE